LSSGRPGPHGLLPKDQGLRSQTHSRGQEQTGDHALPQTLRSPGNIPSDHRPPSSPKQHRPAPNAPLSVAPSRLQPANLASGRPKFPSWNGASSETTTSRRTTANG
jgi:hypothetical protein